jgi:hypothetical protein
MTLTRPRPAYAADAPVAELRTAELFVVSSLRLWVLPHTDPGGLHPDWRMGFHCAGIEDDGADAFDAMLHAIASNAVQTLDVRCPRCPRLGEDEAWLLQLAGTLQRRQLRDAVAILGGWLSPAAVRIAVECADRFAAGLAASGLHLRVPRAATATIYRFAPRATRRLARVQ